MSSCFSAPVDQRVCFCIGSELLSAAALYYCRVDTPLSHARFIAYIGYSEKKQFEFNLQL